MDEKKSMSKEFIRLMLITFACTVLTMSAIGWMFGGTAQGSSAVFSLGDEGLSFQTIFQILLFSIVNSGMALLVNTATIAKKLMLLWQMIITMISCLVVSGIMVTVFGWIPFDSWTGWLWFVGSFIGIFVIAATSVILKMKWEDKRYNNLLSDYKNNKEMQDD